jgi:hypothetical protein
MGAVSRKLWRAGGNFMIHRQAGQETFALPFAERLGMLPAVKEDEPLDPPDVSLLGAQRIVPGAQKCADLGQKWRLGVRHIIAAFSGCYTAFLWKFNA